MANAQRNIRGTVRPVADYYIGGKRHQLIKDSDEEARHHFEAHDDRVRPEQTLAAWLRFRAANLPTEMDPTMVVRHQTGLSHCVDLCPDVTLREMTSDDIDALYDSLLEMFEEPTVQQKITYVSAALDEAVFQKRLDANPVTVWRRNPMNRHKKSHAKAVPADREDYPKILARLPFFAASSFGLISGAGLTLPETLAFRIEHVDFTGKALWVRESYSRTTGEIYTPPLNAIRMVPNLPPELMALLEQAREEEKQFGSGFAINLVGIRVSAYSRSGLCDRLYEQIEATQVAAKVCHPKTGRPYLPESFRDRWVIDRLNAHGRRFRLKIMAQAGYASPTEFWRRYGSFVTSPNCHAEMARARSGRSILTALSRLRAVA